MFTCPYPLKQLYCMCVDKPGGAVEQHDYPAGEDDPLGPPQGADVLNQ